MSGHVRISNDLIIKYFRKRKPEYIAFLASYELDLYREQVRSRAAYARMWAVSRGTVDRLLADRERAAKDLQNHKVRGSREQVTSRRRAGNGQATDSNSSSESEAASESSKKKSSRAPHEEIGLRKESESERRRWQYARLPSHPEGSLFDCEQRLWIRAEYATNESLAEEKKPYPSDGYWRALLAITRSRWAKYIRGENRAYQEPAEEAFNRQKVERLKKQIEAEDAGKNHKPIELTPQQRAQLGLV